MAWLRSVLEGGGGWVVCHAFSPVVLLPIDYLGDPLPVQTVLRQEIPEIQKIPLPEDGWRDVRVEVRHDVVVCERGLENGGDGGRVVYGGWVQCEWHGGVD